MAPQTLEAPFLGLRNSHVCDHHHQGGSGGLNIIPAVIQVFLNHFVDGLEPLAAFQLLRINHRLIPNVVNYKNLTVINGEPQAGGVIVQTLENQVDMGRKIGKDSDNFAVMHGKLVAVKDGKPAAV